MKLQDLTVNDCIVSSTPEEWATVQNIFLMNGYKATIVSTLPEGDTFENHPFTFLLIEDEYMNAYADDTEDDHRVRVPAAEFIAANVPPEYRTGVSHGSWSSGKNPQWHRIPRPANNLLSIAEQLDSAGLTLTDLEQLQDEIEAAVRKDMQTTSYMFYSPTQLEEALATVNFQNLRELLAQRFPLMNSIPVEDNNGHVHQVKDFVTQYTPPEGSPPVNYTVETGPTELGVKYRYEGSTDELVDRILEEQDKNVNYYEKVKECSIPNEGFKAIDLIPMGGTANIVLRSEVVIGNDHTLNQIILTPTAQRILADKIKNTKI